MTEALPQGKYNLRRYQQSDQQALLDIFRRNIREEWGTRYHGGRYLANAEKYIEGVCSSPDSDLNSIEKVYFQAGGFFWTLVFQSDGKERVVGMCGLETLSSNVGELRRMCLLPDHRRMRWGSRMVQCIQNKARELGLEKIILSTPAHGADVLAFYKRNGFVDTIDDTNGRPKRIEGLHGTPISEVFLEWKSGE